MRRDTAGAVLSSAATAAVYLTISDTKGGGSILQVSTGTGEITLADSGTAQFNITIPPASYTSLLAEGQTYYYSVWTVQSGVSLWQAEGTIPLNPSIIYS